MLCVCINKIQGKESVRPLKHDKQMFLRILRNTSKVFHSITQRYLHAPPLVTNMENIIFDRT